LTSRSGHAHPSQEKQLSTFQRGYDAGMKDAELSRKQLREDADLADMGRPLKFQYQENLYYSLLLSCIFCNMNLTFDLQAIFIRINNLKVLKLF
jgi:hypothetical protein